VLLAQSMGSSDTMFRDNDESNAVFVLLKASFVQHYCTYINRQYMNSFSFRLVCELRYR
jgi:hypothetical protein